MKSPRKSSRTIEESLPAAAEKSGVPIEILQRMKHSGLTSGIFLAGNRTDWQKAKTWIETPGNLEALEKVGPKKGKLQEQKLAEEIRKIRRANDVEDGILMLVSERDREISEMATTVTSRLYNGLDRLAVETAGQTAAHNHAVLTSWVDEAIRAIRKAKDGNNGQ